MRADAQAAPRRHRVLRSVQRALLQLLLHTTACYLLPTSIRGLVRSEKLVDGSVPVRLSLACRGGVSRGFAAQAVWFGGEINFMVIAHEMPFI